MIIVSPTRFLLKYNSFKCSFLFLANRLELPQRPASWASTPDLDKLQNNNKNNNNNNKFEVTVNIPLPKRRHTTTFDDVSKSH
jgi:hypothetical protein